MNDVVVYLFFFYFILFYFIYYYSDYVLEFLDLDKSLLDIREDHELDMKNIRQILVIATA